MGPFAGDHRWLMRRVRLRGAARTCTLLFLCGPAGWVAESDLISWVEHSNSYVYRRDILVRTHKRPLIEYDDAVVAPISPHSGSSTSKSGWLRT